MTDADKYMEDFYNGNPLEWKEEGTEKMWECSKCDGTGREILDFNSNGDPIRDDYCYNCKGTGKLSDEDMERNYQSDQKWKNMASQEDDYIDGSDVPTSGIYESKANESIEEHYQEWKSSISSAWLDKTEDNWIAYAKSMIGYSEDEAKDQWEKWHYLTKPINESEATDDYEVDVDEYIETGEPVEKLPEDKRKHDSLNFDPSYEAETSDAEYEDWIQDKTDEDTTRDNLEKLQEETVEESFGDCGCKMTNKAKETWEGLTDSDKQLELRDMGVDEGYAYYPFEHLPKKIGEAFVDKFNIEENGDSLGWNKITALERADTLRKIGFTPRDSELVSNLEYQQLSESLKKDVNEALNYKVKAQESQVPQDKSQEKFENGLYSNMYDGYLERRGSRVESKKKQKILENNNFGLDISKVKGVEATVTKDIWDNIDDIISRLTLLERAGYQEDLRTGYYSGKETWDKLAELSNNEVTGALSGVQISEQEIKETTNTGYFPDMFGGRVDRWGDKYEDNDPYVYESKASEVSIDDFKRIVDRHQNETLQFDDGKVIVDAFTANAVVQVYNALSEEQKQTFNDVVKTSGGVSKVANLAFKHGESKANEDGGYANFGSKSKENSWSVLTNASDLWFFETRDEAEDYVRGFPEGSYQINPPQLGESKATEKSFSELRRIADDIWENQLDRDTKITILNQSGVWWDDSEFEERADYSIDQLGGLGLEPVNVNELVDIIFDYADDDPREESDESKATERDFYRSNKEISDQGDDIQAEAEFGKKYSELSDSEKGYIEYIKNEFGDVKSYDEWVTSGTESKATEEEKIPKRYRVGDDYFDDLDTAKQFADVTDNIVFDNGKMGKVVYDSSEEGYQVKCDNCDGSGEDDGVCKQCNGKGYNEWGTYGTEAQVMGTPMTNYDRFGREWGFSIINHGYGEGSETPYEVGIFLHDEIHKKNDVKGWLNEEEALYYKAKFEVDPIDAFRSIGGQMDSIVNPDFVEQTEDNWNLWESLQDSVEASLSDPDNKKYNMDTDFGFSFSDKDIEALDAETDVELSVDNEANQNRDEDGQFTSDLPEEKNEDYGKNPYSGKVNVPFVEAKESKSKAEEAFDNGASAEKIYSLVDDKGTDDDRSESEEEYLNNLYNKTNANKSAGLSDLQ